MGCVDLKGLLEVFKVLPGEEYALFARACEQGLELSPYAVDGMGREILKENKELFEFLEKLNESFPIFEKAALKKEELENLLLHNEGRGYSDYFGRDGVAGKLAWADGCVGGGNFFGAIGYGIATGTIGTLEPCFVWWVVASAVYLLFTAVAADPELGDGYYGPLALAVCSAQYVRDKQLKRRRLQRSVGNAEKGLRKDVIKKRFGIDDYSQKWRKKIEEDLLGRLLSCDESFPAKFMDVEGRLLPEDRLSLYKSLEARVRREVGQVDYTQEFEGVKKAYGIAGLARKAGIGVEVSPSEIRKKIGASIPELKKRREERVAGIRREAEERIRGEHEFEGEEIRKRRVFLLELGKG